MNIYNKIRTVCATPMSPPPKDPVWTKVSSEWTVTCSFLVSWLSIQTGPSRCQSKVLGWGDRSSTEQVSCPIPAVLLLMIHFWQFDKAIGQLLTETGKNQVRLLLLSLAVQSKMKWNWIGDRCKNTNIRRFWKWKISKGCTAYLLPLFW